MLDMSGDRKKEACDEIDNFELLVGPAGLAELMGCEGDFPAEFRQAQKFCGTAGSRSSSFSTGDGIDKEHMCMVAKKQVRCLWAKPCHATGWKILCVQANI